MLKTIEEEGQDDQMRGTQTFEVHALAGDGWKGRDKIIK